MKQFFAFNKTTRKWHMAVMAGWCVGIPVLLGWWLGNMEAGKLAALAGLSILYIQSNVLAERMMILMVCCFGILTSFSLGLLFSIHPAVAPVFLSFYAFGVHYALYRLRLTRPPGNFFFIMMASIAICMPFQPDLIPARTGFLAMGAIFTCGSGLLYSLLTLKPQSDSSPSPPEKSRYVNLVESLTFGVFVGISLAIALLLKLENPYWVPMSSAAVMQGVNSRHIRVRGLQRIAGTLAGLGLVWLLSFYHLTPLFIALGIVVTQIIVELLIARNYAIAVVFITVMSIFLAETGSSLSDHANDLFLARLVDIVLGSIIGMIGGWVLFNEQVHYHTTSRIRKTKVMLRRRRG